MAEDYSAGTIFLNVVPSFRGFQQAIRKEVGKADAQIGADLAKSPAIEKGAKEAGHRAGKALGDEIEKSATEAGAKSGAKYAGAFATSVKAARATLQRELKALKIEVDDKELSRDIAKIKAELDTLKNKRVGIDISSNDAGRKVAELVALVEGVRSRAKGIGLDFDLAKGAAQLRSLEKQIKALNDAKIAPQFDNKRLEAELEKARIQVGSFTAKMRSELESASKALGKGVSQQIEVIQAKLEGLKGVRIGVDLSTGEFLFEVGEIERELKRIDGDKVDVAVRADIKRALAAFAEIHLAAKEVGAENPNIKLDVEERSAQAKLAKTGFLARILGATTPTIRVKADTSAANSKLAATGFLSRILDKQLNSSAASFRSFSGILLLASTLGSALIPVIAALVAGFVALGPAVLSAVSGLGILILVLAPVVKALTALSAQSKASARDSLTASNTMRSASEGVADAERSLARARQNAARSAADASRAVVEAKRQEAAGVTSAIDQERQAQESYAQSVQDVQNAELALRQAREAAQQQQEDLKNQIKQNAIDQRQAEVELFNATVAYQATQNDGASTNLDKYQATTRLQQARLSMEELRQQHGRLLQAQKNPNDVNSPHNQVRQAQDALTAALQQQADAERALGQAAKAVDEARVKGAQAVAAAIRSQHQAAVDNAQAIGDAQRGLTRAQEQYQVALKSTSDVGSSSMNNVRSAMSKLTPEGRKFTRFLYSLRDTFKGLQGAADPVFGGLTFLIRRVVTKDLPGLKDFIHDMAGGMAGFFRDLGRSLTGREFTAFFRMMDQFGPRLFRQFGKSTISWMQFFATLMTITAPYAERLSKAILHISRDADRWLNSASGTKTWQRFMSYAARVGPAVVEFFKQLAGAALNIAVALAPLGEIVLHVATKFLHWIAAMDPSTLGVITVAILTMVATFQVLTATLVLIESPFLLVIAAAVALAAAGYYAYLKFKPFRDVLQEVWDWSGKLKVVLGILGLAIAAIVLEMYRATIVQNISLLIMKAQLLAIKAWEFAMKAWAAAVRIAAAVQWLWNAAMSANPIVLVIVALVALVAAIVIAYKHSETFRKIVDAVFSWLKNAVVATINFVRDHWQLILAILTGPIGLFALFVYKHWETIKGYFIGAKDWVVNHFVDLWSGALGKVSGAVQTIVDDIKNIWDTLKGIFEAPISFVIDVVLNKGLIGAFNWIADKIPGIPSLKPIPNPFHDSPKAPPPHGSPGGGHTVQGFHTGGTVPGFARGGTFAGIYPGWTPGRDIATIGVSGGEAVMRPEWTKAVRSLDPSYIDRANELARTGGVDAVRRYLGAFTAPRVPNKGHFFRGGVVGDYERLNWRGHQFDGMTVKLLLDAERRLGQQFSISQGSFSTAVAASGGTHAGGGAVDIGGPWTRAAVAALRLAGIVAGGSINVNDAGDPFAGQKSYGGFAAWQRDPSQGPWNNHIHAVVVGDKLESPGAKQQVLDYLHGGNGLGGADDGPQVGLAGILKGGGSDQSVLGQITHGLLNGIVGFGHGVLGLIGDPLGYLTDKLEGPLHALEDKFGGPDSLLVQMAEAIPKALVSKLGGFIADHIPAIGGHGDLGKGPIGDVWNTIRQVAAKYGWDAGAEWNALAEIVNSESGGNPLAQNPTSTAYGLFQFLDGTWGSVGGHKTSDPLLQSIYGLKYIAERYGDPIGAWNFHVSHGYYSDGGVVPEGDAPDATMFDNGGYLPPGLTTVLNLTGKPEPVFTSDQWDRIENGRGGGGITIPITMAGGASPTEVGDAMVFALRKARAAGLHGTRI